MSFLEAVRAIGQRELDRLEKGPLSDIDSFTQMPMNKDEDPKEIHVILDVEDPSAVPLDVRGIKKIDPADYWAKGGDERTKKLRYLYRNPSGANAQWRWSPLYKLGKGVADARQALMGKGDDWRKDTGSHFYKLYKRTLLDFEKYEKFKAFSSDSVERIMDALATKENIARLEELWSDKKRSYILLFGLLDGDRFLYPVDIPAFLGYFRARLADSNTSKQKSGAGKAQSKKTVSVRCAICHGEETAPVNLNKVFKFATFDKKSFLPGLDDSEASKAKVFPLCQDCYRLLSEGRNVIDKKFLDTKSISGLGGIYTVPELVVGNDDLGVVGLRTQAFLRNGLRHEGFLSKRVLKCGDGLVYHFLFWEPVQDGMRILLMVEDVPPSRLSKLEAAWKETVSAWKPFEWHGGDGGMALQRATLWQAIKVLWLIMLGGGYNEDGTNAKDQKKQKRILGLSGNNEGEAEVLRDRLLRLLGCLLRGESVDVMWLKELIVSRLPGLCANSEWVQWSGEISARFWNAIVDFLHHVNDGSKSLGRNGSKNEE